MRENREAVLAKKQGKTAASSSTTAVASDKTAATAAANGTGPVAALPVGPQLNPAQATAARRKAVQATLFAEPSARSVATEPATEFDPASAPARTSRPTITAIPELRRHAYVGWLLNILTLSLMVNVFVVLVLLVAGWQAGVRPQMQLTAPNSLRKEADITFGKEDVNLDDMLLFINTVLPLMHRLDDRGDPDLPLLRGLVAPDIFAKAESDASRQAVQAKKHFIIQNLVVTRIEDVEQDSKHGRVSCYVRGYLAIIIQSSKKNVVLPYRAELLLEMAPPSRLNRFPFVLVKREWRIDQAALDWDSERTVKMGAADDAPQKTRPNPPKPAAQVQKPSKP